MGIKTGVQIYGLKPEMAMCDAIAGVVFRLHSIPCVRTSVTGKKHGTRSLHPVGLAVDYRTKHITGLRRLDTVGMIVADLKEALPCCDVVFEHAEQEQEHIHVEFDPKDDERFQADKAIYRETGVWPQRG